MKTNTSFRFLIVVTETPQPVV